MTFIGSQYRVLGGLALATAGTFWLYLYSNDTGLDRAAQVRSPDVTIDQPRWTLFDERGRAGGQMHADRLERWPGENGARLTEPRLHFSDPRQRPWHAEARLGRLYPDKTAIVLEKQVVLTQESRAGGLVLETERLRIADKGDALETDTPVELKTGSWHVSANGLRSSLGNRRLELHGQVRGVHE